MNRNSLFRVITVGFLSGLLLIMLLVACGEAPSPTGPALPTSTVQILTLPVPVTSNNKIPTATLGQSSTAVNPATATAAVFGDTPTANSNSNAVTATSGLPTTFATAGSGNLNTPNTAGGVVTTLPATANNTALANATATPTAIVPTQNTAPPTPPIGSSPGIPAPTVPVGISPAIINNTSSLTEQHFQLDLGDYQADASLEYPKNIAGPYPTILMFQPYGLYDLDATATTSRFGIGSRNFKVIADQLALHGFAVIRYTKRGYDPSGQLQAPGKDTPIDQLISDANAAFGQIKANPLVDPRKILLLGEDEGATVAMHVAQRQTTAVAGLILIAPVTDPQAAWHYQTVTAPLAYAHQSLDRNEDGLLSVQEWSNAPSGTFLASLQSVALSGDKITSLIGAADSNAVNIDRELKPYLEKTFQAGPNAYPDRADYLASWFKLGNSTALLAGFKQPVLILQGALDQQVPLSQAADLDTYLTQQGNPDHTLLKYPQLGHSLYKLDHGGSDVFGPIDVNLEPPNNPIYDMINWLGAHFS